MANNYPASPAQVNYLSALLAQRDMTTEVHDDLARVYRTFTSAQASSAIDKLRALPYKPRVARDAAVPSELSQILENLPKSKYAISSDVASSLLTNFTPRGDFLFLEVRKYRSTTKILRLVGAPGAFSRYRFTTTDSLALAKYVSRDPLTLTQAFATHYKVCGCCAAELTDQLSRELGLGPVCRKRFSI